MWRADPSASLLRRFGKSAHELGATTGDGSCPDIWELDNGDVAVIGEDMTSTYRSRLPEGVTATVAGMPARSARRTNPSSAARVPQRPRPPASLELAALPDHDLEDEATFRRLAFEVDLSGRTAESVEFDQCRFRSADLGGSTLERTRLVDCLVERTNLANLRTDKSSMQRVRIDSSRMRACTGSTARCEM